MTGSTLVQATRESWRTLGFEKKGTEIMSDGELADEIIGRLNLLVASYRVRLDVCKLLQVRVDVGPDTAQHPTIQVEVKDEDNPQATPQLGFLGVLNGVVGTLPDGPRKGWGYITAEFDDFGQLLGFTRTKNA
jgi:hypothetical protein